MRAVYIDTSAAAKLFLDEAESPALRRFIEQERTQLISSSLIVTELLRTALGRGKQTWDAAQAALDRIALVPITDDILKTAGGISPVALRSLDAIHLATLLSLGVAVEGLLCYDTRLSDTAIGNGIDCRSPR